MTEVVHEHIPEPEQSSNSFAMLAGIILIIALVVLLFFIFGRGTEAPNTLEVSVPDQIDVNVNTPQQ